MTSPDPQSFYQTPMQKSYPDPSSYLVGPSQQQQQQPQQDVSYLHEDDDARAVDERGQFFNQPPVNFPSQNTKSGMDYFELQKLMHPTAAPRKRDVTPSRAYRSSSGAGTPANVSSNEPPKGEAPVFDSYLRHESKGRKQFGGGGTAEFASANPIMPTNIVTDSRIGDNPDKNFKSGGSVPTFVPKNYVAPPNFGSARKMRQNSDSGMAPTYSTRRIKRSSSLSNQPTNQETPPMMQPRRNLARQSKIERNLAKNYGVNGSGPRGSVGSSGGAEERSSSVMSSRGSVGS